MSDETTFGRAWNMARRAQGFKSQAHLDAFYAAYDHRKACAECQSAGKPVETTDGGMQPTEERCPEGLRLERVEWDF